MVFLFIFLAIIILLVLLYFSKIKIEIINFRFDSQTQQHTNKDYKINIKLSILGFITIFKIELTKTKLEKMKLKEKIQKINFSALEKKTSLDQEIFSAIKKINIQIQKINLHIDLGTENACFTSFIVPTISTVIAIILQKTVKKYENQIFIINPIYQNQNLVNLFISGIFEIKMRHIINVIYVFIKNEKKGVKKNERASNRRPYDYGYE